MFQGSVGVFLDRNHSSSCTAFPEKSRVFVLHPCVELAEGALVDSHVKASKDHW